MSYAPWVDHFKKEYEDKQYEDIKALIKGSQSLRDKSITSDVINRFRREGIEIYVVVGGYEWRFKPYQGGVPCKD